MILPPFEYFRPGTTKEALELLAEKREAVRPLAGGTDLIVLMKEGRLLPPALLSLRDLAELRVMETGGDRCTVGAGNTVTAVSNSAVPASNPAFGDIIPQMATPPIRNRATIGGNLCTAAACADFPPVLLVNDAAVRLQSAGGARDVPLNSFFEGPRKTARRPDELLMSITFKKHNPGSAYVKFGVREAVNIAIVGVAGAVQVSGGLITDLRVAVTAAHPVPLLVPGVRDVSAGQRPEKATWERVADVVSSSLTPISDLRGSAEYRLHLAKVATIRVLQKAYERWEEAAHA
ncbi:MAG: xanthine dehydrogenase family protein subunit M [Acidobacteriota bacterium]